LIDLFCRVALEHAESEYQSQISELRASRAELQNSLLDADLLKEELEDKISSLESDFEDSKEDMANKYGEEIGKLKVDLMKITSEAQSSAEQSREELSKVMSNHAKLNHSMKEEMDSQKLFFESLVENEKLKNKELMMSMMEKSTVEIDGVESRIKEEFEEWKLKFEKEKKRDIKALESKLEEEKDNFQSKLSKQMEEHKKQIAKLEAMIEEEHQQYLDSEELAKKSVESASSLSEKLRQVELSHSKFKERVQAESKGRDAASSSLAESQANAEAQIESLMQQVEKLTKALSDSKENETNLLQTLQQVGNNSTRSSIDVNNLSPLTTGTRLDSLKSPTRSAFRTMSSNGSQSGDPHDDSDGIDSSEHRDALIRSPGAQGVLLSQGARSSFSHVYVEVEREVEEALSEAREKFDVQLANEVQNAEEEFYQKGKFDGQKIGKEIGYKEGFKDGEKSGIKKGKIIATEEIESRAQLSVREESNARVELIQEKHEQSLIDVKMELKKAHELVVSELEMELSVVREELAELKHSHHIEEAKRSMTPTSKRVMFQKGNNSEGQEEENDEEDEGDGGDSFQIRSNSHMLSATSPYTPNARGVGRRKPQPHVATPDLRYGLNEERRM
jgi:hypothetical protein